MLLIVEPLGQRQARTEAEGRAVYQQMLDFAGELQRDGLLLAVESLQSQDGAARVQVRGGRTQVIDGPFAEAKEMVGGFFLVNCATREQALELAQRCPAAQWCTVEVRATSPCYVESHAT
jgi:hypothetical protein